MNLDKSTKRISKRVKKGFQAYPQISLSYFGVSANLATEVVVGFTSEEGGGRFRNRRFPVKMMQEKTKPFKLHY